ncbi:hypothetical protein G7Y89_g2934 [Cudoniella acicularis]|uniref:Uncharacterized protein n=1 Tax=Cudoniella acicularis TaxID=354080 RepID=A0A8H4W864_9HELO|nr:hypothetical protein G7Y89_g2934 [Cudoniella acicularis]
MPSPEENIERQKLIKDNKRTLIILKLNSQEKWDANNPGPPNAYVWTFKKNDLIRDEFKKIYLEKPNYSESSREEQDSGDATDKEVPDLSDWSLAHLRALQVSLREGRVSVSLFRTPNRTPKVEESDSDYQESTMSSAKKNAGRVRAHNRLKNRLADAIEAKTGRKIENPSSFNPLVSNPITPYFFEWQFSPEYPAFPKVNGGISRWNAEQHRACEGALDAGYLTVVDTTSESAAQDGNGNKGPAIKSVHRKSSSRGPVSIDSAIALGSEVGEEDHLGGPQSRPASLPRLHTDFGSAPTPTPDTPQRQQSRTETPKPYSDIRAQFEQLLAAGEKEAELLAELGAVRKLLEDAQEELGTLRRKDVQDANDKVREIAEARRDGETVGRSKAIEDMSENHEGEMRALRRHHFEQLEQARKAARDEGFQAGKDFSKGEHEAARERLLTQLSTIKQEHSQELEKMYQEGLQNGKVSSKEEIEAVEDRHLIQLDAEKLKHGQELQKSYDDGVRFGNSANETQYALSLSEHRAEIDKLSVQLSDLTQRMEQERKSRWKDGFLAGKLENGAEIDKLTAQLNELTQKTDQEREKSATWEKEQALQLKQMGEKHIRGFEMAKEEGRIAAYKELALPLEERLDPLRLSSNRKVRELKTIFQNWGDIPQKALPSEMLPEGHTPGDKTLYLIAKLSKETDKVTAGSRLQQEIDRRNSHVSMEARNSILTNADIRKVLETIAPSKGKDDESVASSSQEVSFTPQPAGVFPPTSSTWTAINSEKEAPGAVSPQHTSSQAILKYRGNVDEPRNSQKPESGPSQIARPRSAAQSSTPFPTANGEKGVPDANSTQQSSSAILKNQVHSDQSRNVEKPRSGIPQSARPRSAAQTPAPIATMITEKEPSETVSMRRPSQAILKNPVSQHDKNQARSSQKPQSEISGSTREKQPRPSVSREPDTNSQGPWKPSRSPIRETPHASAIEQANTNSRVRFGIPKELYDLTLPQWLDLNWERSKLTCAERLPLTPSELQIFSDAVLKRAQAAGKFSRQYKTAPEIRNLKFYIAGMALEVSANHYLGSIGAVSDVLRIFSAIKKIFLLHSEPHHMPLIQSNKPAIPAPVRTEQQAVMPTGPRDKFSIRVEGTQLKRKPGVTPELPPPKRSKPAILPPRRSAKGVVAPRRPQDKSSPEGEIQSKTVSEMHSGLSSLQSSRPSTLPPPHTKQDAVIPSGPSNALAPQEGNQSKTPLGMQPEPPSLQPSNPSILPLPRAEKELIPAGPRNKSTSQEGIQPNKQSEVPQKSAFLKPTKPAINPPPRTEKDAPIPTGPRNDSSSREGTQLKRKLDAVSEPEFPERRRSSRQSLPVLRPEYVGHSDITFEKSPSIEASINGTTIPSLGDAGNSTGRKDQSLPPKPRHEPPRETFPSGNPPGKPERRQAIINSITRLGQAWNTSHAISWLSSPTQSAKLLTAVKHVAAVMTFHEVVRYINCAIVSRCELHVNFSTHWRPHPTTADFTLLRERSLKLFPISPEDLRRLRLRYDDKSGFLEGDDRPSRPANSGSFTIRGTGNNIPNGGPDYWKPRLENASTR